MSAWLADLPPVAPACGPRTRCSPPTRTRPRSAGCAPPSCRSGRRFRTGPLKAEARAVLGWGGGEGIHTPHDLFECYQLDAGGRIVGGGKAVHYGFGGRPVPEAPARTRALLERTLFDRFPDIGARIESFWSGPVAFTTDFTPALGASGAHGNLWHALGYAGHGLALASAAGQWVADAIAGRAGPGTLLLRRRRLPWRPEPLRWLAFTAAVRLLALRDAAVDRRARRSANRRDGTRR